MSTTKHPTSKYFHRLTELYCGVVAIVCCVFVGPTVLSSWLGGPPVFVLECFSPGVHSVAYSAGAAGQCVVQ